ncbi:MAG: adenosylcobalamin-dependent ribonucleoside-diphosphate reductase [bacterium]
MAGPQTLIAQKLHAIKYRTEGESYEDSVHRVAAALADDEVHRKHLKNILMYQRFLPAGRIQCAVGSPRATTPYNCFVSGTIPDSMEGIMRIAGEAAQTMRLGGGIGYDFSTLRPAGDLIKSLDSASSGPLSFMRIFNEVCGTIASAGHRRGAQMGILRVDHPDIEKFIHAKNNTTEFTNFNLSVGITDQFMEAVIYDMDFDLHFNNRIYKTVNARKLWDDIMRMTWDYAEPGVIFIDKINQQNNLGYCETIAATNPCGEQPLPPYGACLLGSFNLVKYVTQGRGFDYAALIRDVPVAVRAMDNVIGQSIYPLPEQRSEALRKRRMGLGITGAANAIETIGFHYGSPAFCQELRNIMKVIAQTAYRASSELAEEKGVFPAYDPYQYLSSPFIQKLPPDLFDRIKKHGLRNSHLTSIAPTGTISLTADNVSSGIEPVFEYRSRRTINLPSGPMEAEVEDYAYARWGTNGRVAANCSVEDHINVLLAASEWVDSAVSKTCTVGPAVTFDQFKELYLKAWRGGAKGCTTFRPSGKRFGVLRAIDPEPTPNLGGGQCEIVNGVRNCE